MSSEANTHEKPLAPDDARELIGAADTETLVIDLREAEERDGGYIPGSTTLVDRELKEAVEEAGDDATIVLVCEDGERSAELAEELRGDGHNATSVDGGMDAWFKKKMPIQPKDEFTFKGPGDGVPGT